MVSAGELANQIGSLVGPLVSWGWLFIQLFLIMAALAYFYIYASYNVKVMLRDMTKNNRTIVKMVRARRIKSKDLNIPKIKFFGTMGFGGKTINQPPSECTYPYKTAFGNTVLYDFVVKDGIHYPISNTVMGRRYILNNPKDDAVVDWAKEQGFDIKDANEKTYIYSMEGSGLEVTRDFDAEQSTLNDLIAAAERYRNKKPGEMYMLYGFAILSLVGAIVTIVYSLYQTGQVTEAVNQGWELFREWTEIAQTTKAGPG